MSGSSSESLHHHHEFRISNLKPLPLLETIAETMLREKREVGGLENGERAAKESDSRD